MERNRVDDVDEHHVSCDHADDHVAVAPSSDVHDHDYPCDSHYDDDVAGDDDGDDDDDDFAMRRPLMMM